MHRFIVVVLVLVSLFSVFASGNNENNGSMTVVDQIGRTVEIKEKPERIVSGYYISSSACIAMGLQDKIVGVEANASERPIYKLAFPSIVDMPNVGTAKAFNLETCLSLNPDLVILPKKQKDSAIALSELGIPAIVVNPESHEQIIEMFELIGKATFSEKAAEKLISRYKSILFSVEKRTLSLTVKPVVYICGTGSYLTTAPRDMYQAKLIELAGGINAGDCIDGSSWKEISYEQFLSLNPDVIIIPTNSNANANPDYGIEDIKNDSLLKDIKAVKNNKIYQMPYGLEAWDSPVPSGALGVMWMLNTLHPAVCSDNTLKREVDSFYKDLYGFNPDF